MDAIVDERWREERRARILAGAARVFARAAYDDASMDGIAAEAGIGKPTLYRYFASKELLYAAVFSHALDALEERLRAVSARTTSLGERFPALVAEIAPVCREHLVPLRFLGPTAASADQSKRRVFRERRSVLARHLAAAVDRGVATGEVRPGIDGTRVAHLTIGMIWSAAGAGLSDEEIAGSVTDILLHGIVAGAATASSPPSTAATRPPLARAATA